MRIFSSAEYCLRVARRMSLIICSAGAFPVPDFCLIFAPLKGYDEPEILRSQLSRFGPISANAGHYGIKVQTINPGAYYTGYNETMADNPFRWLDDEVNVTKRADLRKGFDNFFATPEGKMDPKEMIDRMIEVVPADEGKFRNVVPKGIEDMLKQHQLQAWENRI